MRTLSLYVNTSFASQQASRFTKLAEEPIALIEGLALQTPLRSMAAIHRQVVTIAKEQRWKPPGYERVRQIIKALDPALVTLAHQGAAAYREEFDLLYRREATHSNAMWQADHTPLDVWLLDEAGEPAKPYLTAIEDDYSRVIVGYRLSFQPATALTTALTLRQAIWHKEDPRWSACGIPSVLYTDHGSDFTSKHLEQVAADLRMELVFSEKGVPRGRGKVERFFRSVDQLFLQDIPGYAPKGYGEAEAILTLPAFEQRFRKWLLEDYHYRVHSETECIPKDRWEAGGVQRDTLDRQGPLYQAIYKQRTSCERINSQAKELGYSPTQSTQHPFGAQAQHPDLHHHQRQSAPTCSSHQCRLAHARTRQNRLGLGSS